MRYACVLLFWVLLLFGCEQQDPVKSESGKVYPSDAYRQHFGEPPAVRQGEAYAHVGYLPLRDGSGRVRALPLFLYDETQAVDQILARLFSSELVISETSGIQLPAQQGVRLSGLDQAGDTLVVQLETTSARQAGRPGIDRAIAETALQFAGINRVRINYDGKPSAHQPVAGYQHRLELIAPVGPPNLLDVVGVWANEDQGLEEILINFDRPVRFNGFRLLNQAGEQIAGGYYTSIFNMAVVVHPDEPEVFVEGMELNVSWRIEDFLGRRNSALSNVALGHRRHLER